MKQNRRMTPEWLAELREKAATGMYSAECLEVIERLRKENRRLSAINLACTAPAMSDYGPDTPHDVLLAAVNSMRRKGLHKP